MYKKKLFSSQLIASVSLISLTKTTQNKCQTNKKMFVLNKPNIGNTLNILGIHRQNNQ